jgi:hypothetical protein
MDKQTPRIGARTRTADRHSFMIKKPIATDFRKNNSIFAAAISAA